MQHICKMEKFEIRVAIKYFYKKGMPPQEIHEYFMETLGKEYPSYNKVKKLEAELKKGRQSVEDDEPSGGPIDAIADKNVMVVHTLVMCDRMFVCPNIPTLCGHYTINFRDNIRIRAC